MVFKNHLLYNYLQGQVPHMAVKMKEEFMGLDLMWTVLKKHRKNLYLLMKSSRPESSHRLKLIKTTADIKIKTWNVIALEYSNQYH